MAIYSTVVSFGESATDRRCDIGYYYTPGYPQTMDSPEELPEVEIDSVICEGIDLMSFVELEELERIANEIYEAIGNKEFNEPEEYIYE